MISRGLYKYFKFLILLPLSLAFSVNSLANEYNSSWQLEDNYNRQEVRQILSSSKEKIKDYCLGTNLPYEMCFNIIDEKFTNIFADNYQVHPHWEFLRTCQNEHLEKQDNYFFNEFFSCFDHYIEVNEMKTPKPEINYLFLLSNYENYLRASYCRYNTSGVSVRSDNECRNQQTRNYSFFKSMWFSSATNSQFRFAIENCIDRYMIKNNNNIIIDFYGVVDCIQN